MVTRAITRALLLFVAFAPLAGMITTTARAQDAEPSPSAELSDEEARGFFIAGRAAFADGRFEEALRHFRHAHELSGRPTLLFNIAATYDRLRRDQEALATFREYLRAVPDALNVNEVRARMAVLEHAAAPTEQVGERDADEGTVAEHDRHEGGAATDGGGGGPVFAWVALGGAVVFGGLAAAFWLLGNAEFDELEGECGSRGCTAEEVSTLETFDTSTTVALVLTASSGIAGGVLFVLEAGSAEEATVDVSAGPGGLSIRGSF